MLQMLLNFGSGLRDLYREHLNTILIKFEIFDKSNRDFNNKNHPTSSRKNRPSHRGKGVRKLQADGGALFRQGRTGVDQEVLVAGPEMVRWC